jgi:serine/threonine protein kinase
MSAGTRLGPYEIVSILGAGGMGEVYKARDARLARDVAVKVLPPELSHSPQARQRFQREAAVVAALQHPNICTVHDVGEMERGEAFLVGAAGGGEGGVRAASLKGVVIRDWGFPRIPSPESLIPNPYRRSILKM